MRLHRRPFKTTNRQKIISMYIEYVSEAGGCTAIVPDITFANRHLLLAVNIFSGYFLENKKKHTHT